MWTRWPISRCGQVLEITFDRHGAQLGEVRPRSMRPDAWLPGHYTLRLYSASVGSANAQILTRLWPLPGGPDGTSHPANTRAAPPIITGDWLRDNARATSRSAPRAVPS
eukprot:318243-Pyramimonas_sp.AAC.1